MSDNQRLSWIIAIGGGLIGSLVTAGLLLLAAPQLIGPKLVRDALINQPQILVDASDALRDGQYAPMLSANTAMANASLALPSRLLRSAVAKAARGRSPSRS